MADLDDAVVEGPKLSDGSKVAEEDDPGRSEGDGSTALHAAADAGDKARVRELVLAGADVNALNSDGKTALHLAARRGDPGVTRALLSAGADATLRHGRFQFSALDCLIFVDVFRKSSCAMVALFALIDHGVDVNAVCVGGLTPLHLSVLAGNIAAPIFLLEAGADLEARDACGCTPLHVAVEHGKLTVLMLLLSDWGADMDALDDGGRSALHLAAGADNSSRAVKMVQTLLDAGASIGDHDERGLSALHVAAKAGNAGVLTAMIEHDVDVTAVASDPIGFTAIHCAAYSERDNPKAIDVLVEAGADIAALETHGGRDCLFAAADQCNVNAAQAILRHAAGVNGLGRMDLQRALRRAATRAGEWEKPAAPVVDLLLRRGAHECFFSSSSAWRLIGRGAPPDSARQEDVRRVRELLTNAPKDRAWRRRGFIVVCRAFPDKARLWREGRLPQCDTPERDCARPRLATADGSAASEWAGVAGALLWLDEGVFRTVMEYV
eukprot:g2548.t1